MGNPAAHYFPQTFLDFFQRILLISYSASHFVVFIRKCFIAMLSSGAHRQKIVSFPVSISTYCANFSYRSQFLRKLTLKMFIIYSLFKNIFTVYFQIFIRFLDINIFCNFLQFRNHNII